MTPLVVRSEYPKLNTVEVPWWWSRDDEAQLRHRLEKLIEGGDISELETVDHGVFVGSDGDRPVRSGGDREERADPCWEPLEGRLRRVSSEARHSR